MEFRTISIFIIGLIVLAQATPAGHVQYRANTNSLSAPLLLIEQLGWSVSRQCSYGCNNDRFIIYYDFRIKS